MRTKTTKTVDGIDLTGLEPEAYRIMAKGGWRHYAVKVVRWERAPYPYYGGDMPL